MSLVIQNAARHMHMLHVFTVFRSQGIDARCEPVRTLALDGVQVIPHPSAILHRINKWRINCPLIRGLPRKRQKKSEAVVDSRFLSGSLFFFTEITKYIYFILIWTLVKFKMKITKMFCHQLLLLYQFRFCETHFTRIRSSWPTSAIYWAVVSNHPGASVRRFWATLLLRTTCMRLCCNGVASCVTA